MNVFELVAGLTLDTKEYMKSLDLAQNQGTSKLQKGLGLFAKGAAVAFTAGATAIGAMTKKSLDAYANFEQLEGGVKKLYGNGAKELMNYANQAYMTSGMSANAYMETATSFSASLINSLGGDQKKAASQTDKAMKAISDNYNTFGGDIENVKNAYQGFAKQNYTIKLMSVA